MVSWKRIVLSSCAAIMALSVMAWGAGCMSNCNNTCGDITGWEISSQGQCTQYRPSSCPWFIEWCAAPAAGYDDCINVCKMTEWENMITHATCLNVQKFDICFR